MAIIKDDRTETEKLTLTTGIVGTDRFLSGWRRATNGLSYAVWACTPENVPAVEYHVRRRSDMKRVRVVSLKDYRARGAKHCHIYVASQTYTEQRYTHNDIPRRAIKRSKGVE